MASRPTCTVSALPEAHLQRFGVQVGLGQQLLELGNLAFDLAQRRDLAGLHAAELGAPL